MRRPSPPLTLNPTLLPCPAPLRPLPFCPPLPTPADLICSVVAHMQVRKRNGTEHALAVNRPVVRIVSPVEAYLDDRGNRKVDFVNPAPVTPCHTDILLCTATAAEYLKHLYFQNVGTRASPRARSLGCWKRRLTKLCSLVSA